jgi:hypothetical protein
MNDVMFGFFVIFWEIVGALMDYPIFSRFSIFVEAVINSTYRAKLIRKSPPHFKIPYEPK